MPDNGQAGARAGPGHGRARAGPGPGRARAGSGLGRARARAGLGQMIKHCAIEIFERASLRYNASLA